MKKALKTTIKRWIDDKLIETKEKVVCGYCESGEVYRVKKQDAIFCRKCGKLSQIKEENEKPSNKLLQGQTK